jgi:hypothetical protein
LLHKAKRYLAVKPAATVPAIAHSRLKCGHNHHIAVSVLRP